MADVTAPAVPDARMDKNGTTATMSVEYGRYESGRENRDMLISCRDGTVIGVAARTWTGDEYQWAVADWTACWPDLGINGRHIIPHPRTIYRWDDSYGQRVFTPSEEAARKLLATLAAANT